MNQHTSCNEIDELLPAYVLDALEPDEYLTTVAHLADCRRHDEELAWQREVVSRLPDVLEPLTPRASLRDSLLRTFDAESAPAATVPVARQPVASEPNTLRPPSMWERFFGVVGQPRFAVAGIAALVLIAAGIGASAVTLCCSGDDSTTVTRTLTLDGASMQVTYDSERQVAVVDNNMPVLPASQAYQAWKITPSGDVSSLGLLPAKGLVAIKADLSDANTIAVTVEPSSGSARPSLPPIAALPF